MRAADGNFQSARFLEGVGGLHNCSGRINHIIQNDNSFAFDITDDIHHLGFIGAFSSFIDNGQACSQPFSESPGAFHTAGIR